jgi:uncharacterized protein HemX
MLDMANGNQADIPEAVLHSKLGPLAWFLKNFGLPVVVALGLGALYWVTQQQNRADRNEERKEFTKALGEQSKALNIALGQIAERLSAMTGTIERTGEHVQRLEYSMNYHSARPTSGVGPPRPPPVLAAPPAGAFNLPLIPVPAEGGAP